MEQGGRFQNDGGTENACRPHEESAQAGDDTISGTQVGRTLSATIEDQQSMPDQGESATTERTPPRLANRTRETIT